jgi:hypothetical protein
MINVGILLAKSQLHQKMRHTVRIDRPPTTESNLNFRWACHVALLLVLVSTGLVVVAFFAAHKAHDVRFSTDWSSV